ncbi:hypothetical protein [Vibrio sp. Hep-1b-8]|uniref:hypothetical protein n=1 Tax=Vibrio sp. Hep-1b-8 TaxID=2144187 RepID=UPI0011109F0C|nr:hypothetical protein [Vibrio sp. Hep-1b-8]TMX38745.1 hypothetical protein DA100_08675 [Vibrio sp. Hep-1b-8]
MKQKGIVTLILSSVLLTAALGVSMGLFRGVFFHIKQAQNQIRLSQTHWLVEGGIECAFARIKRHPDVLVLSSPVEREELFNDCLTAMELDELLIEPLGSQRFVIRATRRNYGISRRFYYGEQTTDETIQSVIIHPNAENTVIRWLNGGWNAE